jgi:hypothetical protein
MSGQLDIFSPFRAGDVVVGSSIRTREIDSRFKCFAIMVVLSIFFVEVDCLLVGKNKRLFQALGFVRGIGLVDKSPLAAISTDEV